MRKKLLAAPLFAALILILGLVVFAHAELNLDFKLVNKTGYDIKEVYIGPTSSDEWGENILAEGLKDGESASITFSPKATAKKWDIKVVYADKDTAEWKGYKLEEITKISLYWNAEKQVSTAKTE